MTLVNQETMFVTIPLDMAKSDYLRAIEQSCDIYFYKVSGGYQDEVPNGLGIVRMADYAKALGYGQITGIELPGEATGLVPDPTWKRINLSENWSTGDTYIAAMGQGFVLSTPIQVMVSAAIIANDGKYMQPTLVKEILDYRWKCDPTIQTSPKMGYHQRSA